jgi:uncharacterized RDD family membrane protein YckC
MRLKCPQCEHILEYSGERPSFCAYCGKPLSSPILETTGAYDPEATRPALPSREGEADEVPSYIGRYHLLRPLGTGGMGTVYEAEDSSGRHVALKLISPEFATSPDALERFRQEGRLASIIAHPRCVFVLAADEDAGRPYIVMELMSGTTLQELVEKNGPLPQEEAVAKILDVIEGLQEAHRLNVIHRDVKPSNCFLLADGRVKIGDFGLAKSLVKGTQLTRTGTFLGTLLYAPPEQIKGETTDFRTDIYSVAATLYHLLTGRPPFQGSDAAATLAKTVSEPPPPLRRLRPELSQTLEQVILRGLQRQREQRWRDLEEFHAALLPFAPGQIAPAGLGARWGAFIIDYITIFLPLWVLLSLLRRGLDVDEQSALAIGIGHLVYLAGYLVLWVVLEGLWGWSPGKRLLRLRVWTATGRDPPGWQRALLRTVSFYVLFFLPTDLLWWTQTAEGDWAGTYMASGICQVLGILLLLAPMRRRNGYRGLHEFLSGTRVVSLPWRENRRVLRSRHPERMPQTAPRPEDIPERIGSFTVRGALEWTSEQKLLSAEDTVLARKVWIQVQPGTLSTARRDVARPTRLRWLAGSKLASENWDAFLAPEGSPLPDLVEEGAPLSWGEVRPLLFQLTDELVAACADGTLPATLSVQQVWVQPNGRVQLLDAIYRFASAAPCRGETINRPAQPEGERSLALLRQVAVLALEGRLQAKSPGESIHAPVPAHAIRLLDRLMGVEQPYEGVDRVQSDLIALQGQPTEVSMSLRTGHLALLVAFLYPLLVLMLGMRWVYLHQATKEHYEQLRLWRSALDYLPRGDSESRRRIEQKEAEDYSRLLALRQTIEWDWAARLWMGEDYWRTDPVLNPPGPITNFGPDHLKKTKQLVGSESDRADAEVTVGLGVIVIGPLLCVLWSFAVRGGLTYRLMGIELLRSNGRRAWRVQCAWRTFLFWLPVTVLLGVSLWWEGRHPEMAALSFWLWGSALAILLGYMLLALWFPTRSLHDRLAGTYLVPR